MKRCAIIGTAQSWQLTPWADKTLEIWTLNDGYVLGYPRIDRHYDVHPMHQMNFRPQGQKTVNPDDVPFGSYLRPAGHLEWLRTRPFPVYLMAPQDPARWPNARVFPMGQILAAFKGAWPYRLQRSGQIVDGKDYEVSTPALMLMHAIVEGYDEVHIYGIHLATEWEYVQQRPNMEFLIGYAAGKGIKVVLPETTPICKSHFRYAYELKADIPLQELQHKIARVKHAGAIVQQELAALPKWNVARRKDLDARRLHLDVELADLRQQLGRAQLAVA